MTFAELRCGLKGNLSVGSLKLVTVCLRLTLFEAAMFSGSLTRFKIWWEDVVRREPQRALFSFYSHVGRQGVEFLRLRFSYHKNESSSAGARTRRQARTIEGFDREWYLSRYEDVAGAGIDPLQHYLARGIDEGRAKNAEEEAARERAKAFDREWYLSRYEDVAGAGIDPLQHYLAHGIEEGRAKNAEEEAARERAKAFDSDWYLSRYEDVAGAGIDPLQHYLAYGIAEGRAGCAEEETLHVRYRNFDSEWYLKRYPDVAVASCEPFEHFVQSGVREGRAGNAAEDCAKAWEERFDPVWYLARNPDAKASGMAPLRHFLYIGLKEGRAPNSTEESRALWRDRFDPAWYAERYPEVVLGGFEPWDHFIAHGLVEGRRPNSRERSPSAPVEQSKVWKLKESAEHKEEIAIFVTVAVDGALKPHVPHYLHALMNQNVAVILVVATDDPNVYIPSDLLEELHSVLVRENRGFDFAAWAHVLRRKPVLWNSKILYLLNDSVFGPTSEDLFAKVIARIRVSEDDLIALTENTERGWHLQSYFLALTAGALRSPACRNFFDEIVAFEAKEDVVDEYETRLAGLLRNEGLRCVALFPTHDTKNPMVFAWRSLLAAGLPFVKVIALRRNRERDDWRVLLSSAGYDPTIVDATLLALQHAPAYASDSR